MDKAEALWKYYSNLAEQYGYTVNEDGEKKRLGYSVSWFYEDNSPCSLNTLTRAFLGSEEDFADLREQDKTEYDAGMEKKVKKCCTKKPRPNPAQISAIAAAITKPITIVQGPPGTGKTETIKNLLLCLRTFRKTAKIAVVSSNSEAIQNIVDLVREDKELWSKCAVLGNREKREGFKTKLEEENPELAQLFSNHWDENGGKFPPDFLDYFPILFSTIHSLRNCIEGTDNQFDYVVVDECSQVSSMIGILAMASAKHLVLFGDDEQLSPIYNDKLLKEEESQEIRADAGKAGEYYLDEEENSFMHACFMRFEAFAGKYMLNEHYRCHPAIIGFCNKYFYEEKLEIKTRDDGKFPIRIRWYEGDYWESTQSKESGKSENYNKKQIEVFIQEEYPHILDRIKKDPEYSACVLSPYRKQLKLLKERLDRYNDENGTEIEESELKDADPRIPEIPQLTIHKAQGRGYDYVCVMPVVDSAAIWPQGRRITNVAVSRAKKELCYITSANWMPRELQERLIEDGKLPDEISRPEGYLCRLFDYVNQNQTKETQEEGFGLQKTSLKSVFDKVPYYKSGKAGKSAKNPDASAPERCVLEALASDDFFKDFEIHCEVPLSRVGAIRTEDKEVQEYIRNGARFDFVIYRDGRICYIIEVDGSYHRDPVGTPDMVEYDRKKNIAVESIGADFSKYCFVRIPTDGTTDHEIEKIKEALKKEAKQMQVMDTFKKELNQIYREFCKEMESDPEGGKKRLAKMEFRDGSLPDYRDELIVRYYLLRYAMAYTFEYAVMYQIALWLLRDENNVTAYSFGCGSKIDGVALAYAREKMQKHIKCETLYYRGIDLVEWPVSFTLEGFTNEKFFRSGMEEFMKFMYKEMCCNILCFPKILSENLDDAGNGKERSIIDQFCDGLSDKKLRRDRIVLCISYRSKYTRGEDMSLTKKIVEALEKNGYRREDVSLPQDIPELKILKDQLHKHLESDLAYYMFENAQVSIKDINPDFEIPSDIWNCTKKLAQESEKDPDLLNRLKYTMKYVDKMCFQVLLFVRKQKE